METKILKVMAQGEPVYVPSKRKENERVPKCLIKLREMNSFGDEFIATLWGNDALCKYGIDKLVAVSLWFKTHENEGTPYQDILVQDIRVIG